MKPKKFNVVRAKKYTDSNGQEQTSWKNVGMITLFQKDNGESGILELNHQAEEYQVFPFTPKNEQNSAPQSDAPMPDDSEIPY